MNKITFLLSRHQVFIGSRNPAKLLATPGIPCHVGMVFFREDPVGAFYLVDVRPRGQSKGPVESKLFHTVAPGLPSYRSTPRAPRQGLSDDVEGAPYPRTPRGSRRRQ